MALVSGEAERKPMGWVMWSLPQEAGQGEANP